MTGEIHAHEEATETDLLHATEIFEALGVKYWLDGGWGIDVLLGKQTRTHRDIDIDFDAAKTADVLSALIAEGYTLETDELPVRAELYSPSHGYIDIHPFVLGEGCFAKQANPEGGFWEFDETYFTIASHKGYTIPCLSPKGQMVFHEGYEPRDKDLHDIPLIKSLLENI